MNPRGWLAALALVAAGCDRAPGGPLRTIVIGDPPRVVDANLRAPGPSDAVLMGAVAEGLVRLDAGGQIVPGLAERWSVSDDGLDYIFRLGDRHWGTADGSPVTAPQVARSLRAAAGPRSRNALAPMLTGIEEIVATTEEVLEIRLTAPRPNLLYLLARPELGIVRGGVGAGPMTMQADPGGGLRLTRTVTVGEDEERTDTALLHAARVGLAVVQFGAGEADVVLGGTLGDLPVARAAAPGRGTLRFDPAAGMLGLAVVDVSGPLRTPEVRRALAMAIDRDALVAAFDAPGTQPRTTLLPRGPDAPAPTVAYWDGIALPARQAEAARLVRAASEPAISVRVAVPDGPGYRLLFAHLARDWAAAGVLATRVDYARSADLRLVDAVAPGPGIGWILESFACARTRACDAEADAALAAARVATDVRARAEYFATADRRLTDAAVFIPLATPVRWSLVSRRVTGWSANPLAVHALPDLLSRSPN